MSNSADPHRFESRVAELGFFLLFPGFLFYHLATAAGLLPQDPRRTLWPRDDLTGHLLRPALPALPTNSR